MYLSRVDYGFWIATRFRALVVRYHWGLQRLEERNQEKEVRFDAF